MAKLIGVSLPKKIIETKVSDALTLIGLGTAITPNTMSGSFTYGLYRTKDKFNTEYSGSINQYQYKFRYQDMAVNSSAIVYPDLDNTELQQSYGVKGAEALYGKMFLVGETSLISEKVQEISGLDETLEDQVDEVKN